MKKDMQRIIAIGTLILMVGHSVESVAQRRSRGGGGSGRASASTQTVGGGVRQNTVRSEQQRPVQTQQQRPVQTRDADVIVGERATVIEGERGTAVVGERGGAVVGEEGAAAWGEHGAVAVGEEGAALIGERGGVVIGEEVHFNEELRWNEYEPFDNGEEYWKFVAGATTIIAIGAMFSEPPAEVVVVEVQSTPYQYHDHVFYEKVYHEGAYVYVVIKPPVGARVPMLPPGVIEVSGYYHWKEHNTYYQKDGDSYLIVVAP